MSAFFVPSNRLRIRLNVMDGQKIEVPIGDPEGSPMGKIGRGDRTRTCGILVPNQALYQTELRLDAFSILQRIIFVKFYTVGTQGN